MTIRILIQCAMFSLVAACATSTDRVPVTGYDSIELSRGVVKLINNSNGRDIALENDHRIRCVDLNPPGNESPSRFCQTQDEFNSNLERGQDLIRSINANPQP